MADTLSTVQRSHCMSQIKSRNTRPEWFVRRIVHGMGFRYRLHQKDLPGTPDLVFRSRRKVIFVHGCFWHVHSCARGALKPATNAEFWADKRSHNASRDRKVEAALRRHGWGVLIIWECQLEESDGLRLRIRRFLHGTERRRESAQEGLRHVASRAKEWC